jgi:hypothetical protein
MFENERPNFFTEGEDDDFKIGEIDPALTEQWKAARLGKFTSSGIAKLLGKGSRKMTPEELAKEKENKGRRTTIDDGFSETAKTYIYSRAGEVITLESNELNSKAIEWGNEWEETAMRTFEKAIGEEITYFGKLNPMFYDYKDGVHAGGSPDGWIEKLKAVVETKCPFASGNHAEVFHLVKTGQFDLRKFDPEYYGQVQFNILLTGADYGYFVSYDPRVIDKKLNLAYARIEKDENYLSNLEERIALAIETKVQYLTEIGYYEGEESKAAA